MRSFLKRILGLQENPIAETLDKPGPHPEKILQALDLYVKSLGAERGCLLLEVPQSQPEVLYSGPPHLREQFPFSRAVVDAVLDESRGFYCYDSHLEFEGAQSESLKSQAARSFVCAPLVHGSEHYGVVYLDNPTSKGLFSQETLEDLEKFAAMVVKRLKSNENEKTETGGS